MPNISCKPSADNEKEPPCGALLFWYSLCSGQKHENGSDYTYIGNFGGECTLCTEQPLH